MKCAPAGHIHTNLDLKFQCLKHTGKISSTQNCIWHYLTIQGSNITLCSYVKWTVDCHPQKLCSWVEPVMICLAFYYFREEGQWDCWVSIIRMFAPGISETANPTDRLYSLVQHLPLFYSDFLLCIAIINNTSLNASSIAMEFKSHSISNSPFGTRSVELQVEMATSPIFRDNTKLEV